MTLLRDPLDAGTGRELVEREWRAFDDRRVEREPRGGYNGGWRCFACQHFVSGPEAVCGSCGYRHGGINHVAQATR